MRVFDSYRSRVTRFRLGQKLGRDDRGICQGRVDSQLSLSFFGRGVGPERDGSWNGFETALQNSRYPHRAPRRLYSTSNNGPRIDSDDSTLAGMRGWSSNRFWGFSVTHN